MSPHEPATMEADNGYSLQEQEEEPWLNEEDHRILAMATERFDRAFDIIFGGKDDAKSSG